MTLSTEIRTDILERMQQQYEIEQFYYSEAALLDAHRYDEWVELFTEDARYFMPIRRTRNRREMGKEFTKPGESAFFDDSKEVLRGRVAKLNSGTSWAEDPPSRTRHIVTNIRIGETEGDETRVYSNFLLYRTRLKSEEDQWIGSRVDTLRRVDGALLISGRSIYLEQTLLLSRNLSNFF
ncbi:MULTISPECIES: aromatic-ring-hydroxylating dioxygenase subunit beta [unclassified Rhodococcus (in: high G+C Gram-positive bacteria)]|uniref:Beta subunit of buprofezin dioxygenase n=1 Tax=Rhodococcus qingshengii TaxID=334542 RepID=A0A221J3D4_RHOSG|nr:MULTISPECIES: 3-phenylpropionate/cinnamic acid dioxygenase subunit beta [unclassified Rhodococcus (in: high G+C Gram-positive bacteria)]AIW42794.1 beta subunit of buprofenzin dioxygenase [Rhodococcus sp. YL-1]ASM60827.1 beta subunit of buprofezin dioxygenase [Rhodococcus qingshengii]